MKQNAVVKKRRGGRPRKSDNSDTRQALLDVACQEFAGRGLEGARVDRIAKLANVNKQLVYHYFGSKDELYIAVLEEAYRNIREQEHALDLAGLPAHDAMRVLIEFSFDYLDRNREFVALVTDENTHMGEHLNGSTQLEPMNRPIIEMIRETLERGDFKAGLDPFQVYLSIAALSFFYFSNAFTLSRIFGRDLLEYSSVAERRRHVVDFAMSALTKT
ncbi:TetR/AcrR family transcriptional regulator [Sneathiella sp.]|uniref:TetR/AcrR family transcriptional regulator n=1 Tax=Sneathiella sp. TaxID=1964365 RepID=UPI0035675EF7